VVRTSQSGLIPDTIGYFGLSGLIPDAVDLGPAAFMAARKAAGSLHRTSKSGLLFETEEETATTTRPDDVGIVAPSEGIKESLAEAVGGGGNRPPLTDPLSPPPLPSCFQQRISASGHDC
jgi:hypothetical protein